MDTRIYMRRHGEKIIQSDSEMLIDPEKKTNIRTVLTTGKAGIGKTFQTKRFMEDWAKGKSNSNIDVIIPLEFSKLNSTKDRHQSMEGVLIDFLTSIGERGVYRFDENYKILFVLDGLEMCELPLNFRENKDLTDIRQSASMDVLLTNLIKGKLLPSAALWILSQPSGFQKIPFKYIHKVTECQEMDATDKFSRRMRTTISNLYKTQMSQFKTDSILSEIITTKKNKQVLVPIKNLKFEFPPERTVRTVLTRGVAGIGKTFQTKLFMLDWANRKSNGNIDFVIPLEFSKLNLTRGTHQSMEGLLNNFFTDMSERGVCHFDKNCKILFILDGLEKCELPLDFGENKDLTDIRESASMDVLLTNLIKGSLLPSASLWILSQPSGVDKIPCEYIHKVTECHETPNRRKQLVSTLKKRYKKWTIENEDHPNQKNTEHIMINRSEKVEVNSPSDIFKPGKDEVIRTVLTIGEAGIGKSFHAQKFAQAWATTQGQMGLGKEKSRFSWLKDKVTGAKDDLEVLFWISLSELGIKKEQSLLDILNHAYEETKKYVITSFDDFKVCLILDGLDAWIPLNFENKEIVSDIRARSSVDVLLMNLIRGELLPSAKIWVTSRPLDAAEHLPEEYVHRRTEIREKPDVASRRKLKLWLQEEFSSVSEGIDRQKASASLNQIYTELYIIEGESGDVNRQHECQQSTETDHKQGKEKSIQYQNIFLPTPGEKSPPKTVLTTGVAGIGKSFAAKKYMLDWAMDQTNQNLNQIYYIFPLPLRELNLREDSDHSFEELIHQFLPAMRTSEITNYNMYNILIVLEGLDECRLELDFSPSEDGLTDVCEKTSVGNLLKNLIQGNLLPEAQIWITSRHAASNNLPSEKVDRVTEVRGFSNEHKEEYFRRRFNDVDQADKIISHMKKSRSIYVMCHIPVFCWITASILQDFIEQKQEEKMPKTLTDMYIYFLLLQCRQKKVKYEGDETEENSDTIQSSNKETVLSLGKLALDGLQKREFIFKESYLQECKIDIKNTAVFSGLFTQVKRESCDMYPQKLFCFVHLSIQEFMAAFYAFYTFHNNYTADISATEFYRRAVDEALQNQKGNCDLYLRFLLGLSLKENQKLLQELLHVEEKTDSSKNEIIAHIKEKVKDEAVATDRKLNLFYCLNEMHDDSLADEVKKYLHSEKESFETFPAWKWSALTFVLLTSDKNLDVFELKEYYGSDDVLLGLMPVVEVSKTALLSWCKLTEKSCQGLQSSVLCSTSSNVTELDLSHNDLLDSGVELLAEGLKSFKCKLVTLKLSGCRVSEVGCSSLASALKCNKVSKLNNLDLSYNHPGARAMHELNTIAEDPAMKLKTLCLDHCGPQRLKPGLQRYYEELKFDESTAGKRLVFSEGKRGVRTTQKVEEKVQRPKNDVQFKRTQVFCEEGLTDFCYWEVEWEGTVGIAVAYKDVGRGWDSKGGLGCNDKSWSVLCSKKQCQALHGRTSKILSVGDTLSKKIAILLDWKGGSLTYYTTDNNELKPFHTFQARFTESLFPAFWIKKGSVTLSKID